MEHRWLGHFKNSDGKPDIVCKTRRERVPSGSMNGTVRISSVNLYAVVLYWSIVGVADFNGDGQVDISCKTTSGGRVIWLMNGTNFVSLIYLGDVSTSWNIRNY